MAKLFLPIAALALVLLAVACGGGTTDSGQTTAAGAVTFDISLADSSTPAGASPDGATAEYQPKEFTVSPGQGVTFNLTNIGQAVHTMRIAGRDNKYETGDDAVVEPYFVKSGETAVLTWTAPEEAGTYNFRCDFHPQSVGTVVVR